MAGVGGWILCACPFQKPVFLVEGQSQDLRSRPSSHRLPNGHSAVSTEDTRPQAKRTSSLVSGDPLSNSPPIGQLRTLIRGAKFSHRLIVCEGANSSIPIYFGR